MNKAKASDGTRLERCSMYRHILIATDGSDLAARAVTAGLSLAKYLGAKVSVIVVETPVDCLMSQTIKCRKPSGSRTMPQVC
jgi:K+-sensing histidine kinase KdpD